MTNEDIIEIIAKGENSSVEFKSSQVQPNSIAKEIVAYANTNGGIILIGVADNGNIEGLSKDKNYEEWIAGISRNNVIPAINLDFNNYKINKIKLVAVTVPKGKDKPYQTNDSKFLVRVGSTNRNASQAELMRLFQQSGFFHFDNTEIENSSVKDIDFHKIDKQTIEGTLDNQVDRALAIIKNNINIKSEIQGTKRIETEFLYADKVFRELITNACIHRNYSITGSSIRIFLFKNRIEFMSPGKLPNTITPEKLKAGVSFAVNPVIVKFMENLPYIDKLGRGLPMVYNKAVKSNKKVMFEEIGEEFKVTLEL